MARSVLDFRHQYQAQSTYCR